MKLFVEVLFWMYFFMVVLDISLIFLAKTEKEAKKYALSLILVVPFFIWAGFLLWRGY
jgi:hypothetical protein